VGETRGAGSTPEGRAAFQRHLDRLEKWIDMNITKVSESKPSLVKCVRELTRSQQYAPATQEASWLYRQECSQQCEGSDYSDHNDNSHCSWDCEIPHGLRLPSTRDRGTN